MLATAVRALRGPVTCARRHAPRRAAAAVAEVQAEANPFSIVRDDLKLMKLRIKALVENTLDEPGEEEEQGARAGPIPYYKKQLGSSLSEGNARLGPR